MIVLTALLLSAATLEPVAEAARALERGRIEQARAMIGQAVGGGAQGEELERLLADLAAAEGKLAEALERYGKLLHRYPDEAGLLERAAATAWKLGQPDLAASYAHRATQLPGASWRGWNIIAIAADAARNWQEADRAYARAMAIAPQQAELLNNKGWSHLLRGEWETALWVLEQAAAAGPPTTVLLNNLEFAREGLADGLPARRPAEQDDDWAARLNDAGVAAQLRGDRKRAVAAFTRAIEVRPTWYKRAENNIRKIQQEQNPTEGKLGL